MEVPHCSSSALLNSDQWILRTSGCVEGVEGMESPVGVVQRISKLMPRPHCVPWSFLFPLQSPPAKLFALALPRRPPCLHCAFRETDRLWYSVRGSRVESHPGIRLRKGAPGFPEKLELYMNNITHRNFVERNPPMRLYVKKRRDTSTTERLGA